MKHRRPKANVNVTLDEPGNVPKSIILGKKFPCPICRAGLMIRLSRSHKPYCVCFDCGNQLFIRGKLGIFRLTQLIESDKLITEVQANAKSPAVLFNRIVHLRSQRAELADKQGLMNLDRDLENAIQAVDNEIERVQGELSRMANANSGRGKK